MGRYLARKLAVYIATFVVAVSVNWQSHGSCREIQSVA